MKICLLCNRGNMYCGGQGVYLHYLSCELQRLGHEVDIIVGPPYPQVPEGIAVHKVENLNFYDAGDDFLPAQNPFRVFTPLNLYELAATRLWMFPEMLAFSIRAYLKLRQLLAEHRFDIIHDNQTLAYGILLMKSFRIPIVATVHHPLPIDRKRLERMLDRLGQRAGVSRVYPHRFRHTWATRMLQGGMDPLALKVLGGWSTLAMVERYTALIAEERAIEEHRRHAAAI